MSLFYSIREGISGIGRAKLPASVTILTGFFSLLLLGLFVTVSLSFYQVIHEVRSRVELEVFLDDRLSEIEAGFLSDRMKAVAGVGEAHYISRNEAAARFTRDFGEDVVSILGMNPLPRSVKLSILPGYTNPDSIAQIEKSITGLDPSLEIRYNRAYLEGIEKNARLFTLITAGVGGVIALATIVMNAFTVRLAIYARRDRIKTMRLVGATRWFISAPFLIEGAVQGLVSGGLAALGLWLVFEQALLRYEPAIYQILHPSALIVYPGLVLLGMVLGFFGSSWSVGRFLRVS
jgi:cell division transport system permease protein